MPVVNRIAGYAGDMAAWRHWLHRHPELGLDLPQTSAFVAERLREIGVDELHVGIATSGIVAIVNGRAPGPTIGLRADMDALPITEQTGADYASETPGRMHACGHDGHTSMLLGAARYLAETRNFSGRVALIFQPAEEIAVGARAMIGEGILDRFDISRLFALHNSPATPLGVFASRPGPLMAAVDEFTVRVTGKGGHAAFPQSAVDPIAAAAAMVQSIQTIVSRNRAGHEKMVISVTQFHAGTAFNIIPADATINGTIRTFGPEPRAMVLARLTEIVEGTAAAYGAAAELDVKAHCDATINDPDEVAFAAGVAAEIAGEGGVEMLDEPAMGGEDFGVMLAERPGAMFWVGQGVGPFLHHPEFDFNDEAAPIGASFFARLVERAQPL